jgi:hypothetical protein
MALIIGFLVVIFVLGGIFYVFVIQREVPGVLEQRFGVLEALPQDVGKWVTDSETEAGKTAIAQGLRREVRYWHEPGQKHLVKQVRYKNPATGAIVRVEPEEVIKRRRVKAS